MCNICICDSGIDINTLSDEKISQIQILLQEITDTGSF